MSDSTHTDETKSVLEHVGELRKKLFVALLAFIAGAAVAHAYHDIIISYILKPVEGGRLVFLSPLEPLFFIFKVDFIAGLVLAFPVIFWCIFTYVKPALPTRGRMTLYIASFFSLILLLGGLLYAYFFTIPLSLKFLFSIIIPGVENIVTMESYLGFFFAQAMIIMLVFQIPIIVMTGLSLGLFSIKALAQKRRYVYLIGTVALAVLTPTTDVFSLAIVLVPTIVIFELSLMMGFFRIFLKRKSIKK